MSNVSPISKIRLAERLEKRSQKASQKQQQAKTQKSMEKQQQKLVKEIQKESKQLNQKLSKQSKDKLDDEQTNERERTIWIIRRYLSSKKFGDYLTKELGIKYTQAQLRKLKNTSLKNTLHRIRIAVDMRNVDAMYDKMFFHTSLVVEKTLTPFYDVEGLTQNLQNNEEFQCALEKMKIEAEIPNIPPPVQMMMIASQTAIMTHHMNKLATQQIAKKSDPVETVSVEDTSGKTRFKKEIPLGGGL